jgi:hypothetical protein
MSSVPFELRQHLFFWKNILGVIVVAYGLVFILMSLGRHRVLVLPRRLFVLSLLFPVFSLFNMLFRGRGTSVEEQILYFLWPLTLFVIFPVLFPTELDRRRAMIVLWVTNMSALAYGMGTGVGYEEFGAWLDYNYRVSFSYLQPNIYSASWSIVFATSLYFYVTGLAGHRRRLALLPCAAALFFIFLARSESELLFCFGVVVVLLFGNRKWDWRLRFGFANILMAVLVLVSSNVLFDLDRLDEATSRRVSLWESAWALNMANASVYDYLTGRAVLVPANPKYTGERVGFQATRAQTDNVYLAVYLQNGLVGLILFFGPLLLLLSVLARKLRHGAASARAVDLLLLGVWVGVFLEIWGISAIPSFGNVTNILLFSMSAPTIVEIAAQPEQVRYVSGAAKPQSLLHSR